MKTIRVGSRESRLAVIQSEMVMSAIVKAHPGVKPELVTMKTTGDKILDQTLDKIGGKGLFVKELDIALLEGRVDLTVHSSKDLPMELDPRLPLLAFSRREDPRDALVLPLGHSGSDFKGPIGCSSARRAVQLKKKYPLAEVLPVRGNLQTRLRKLDEGQYSALVLAAAGLKRLGLENRISRTFSVYEMLPAAGQGILAVQGRRHEDVAYLNLFHDEEAASCLKAERAFVRALDGGCSSPVAAYAVIRGGLLCLTGLDVAEDGSTVVRSLCGDLKDGEQLGARLARKIREELQ